MTPSARFFEFSAVFSRSWSVSRARLMSQVFFGPYNLIPRRSSGRYVARSCCANARRADGSRGGRTGAKNRKALLYIPCNIFSLTVYTPYTRCANEFVISSTWPCMRSMILWDACSAKSRCRCICNTQYGGY